MKVKELIELLENVDPELPVRVNTNDDGNHWIEEVEIINTGSSGYELEGEVILEIGE